MRGHAVPLARRRLAMRRAGVWGGAACLLLAPWVAMRFTPEVAWSAADFLVFGGLLVVACLACEGLWRRRGDTAWRAAAGLAIGIAFLLVWATLAVGLVGSEDNPANLMMGGVLAVLLLGARAVRLRSRGMRRVMGATAAAQVAVALVASLGGPGDAWLPTLFFAALWLASAWLFGRSRTPA